MYYLFLGIFLNLSACTSPKKVELPPNEAFRCIQDTDCTLIEHGGCCGPSLAINKTYSKKYSYQTSAEACMHIDCANIVSDVRCIKRMCSLEKKKE